MLFVIYYGKGIKQLKSANSYINMSNNNEKIRNNKQNNKPVLQVKWKIIYSNKIGYKWCK